jgi:predicted dienelactone hydrolase
MTTTLLTRRRCLQALGAAASVAAVPALRAEETEGRYTTLDFDWADVARQRPVPVRLYLPEQARPAQRAPVLVFSHGIGGSRRGYTWLGRHLAGSGVASLHLQHVGSDRQVWSGNLFGILGRLQDAATDREAVARAEDLRFALDMLLSSGLAPRLDAGRIVAAGHSYGANTTLLAAGARVEREGRVVPLHDERVRAAIAISAPPFYGEGDPARILAGVTVPSLHVTATEDVIRIPGYFSGVEDRLAVFEAVGSPRKWLAVYEGGSHSMFTDRAGTGGVLLNPQVKAATQALVSAFLRSVFDGDDGELRRWPQQHTEILARFTARAA